MKSTPKIQINYQHTYIQTKTLTLHTSINGNYGNLLSQNMQIFQNSNSTRSIEQNKATESQSELHHI